MAYIQAIRVLLLMIVLACQSSARTADSQATSQSRKRDTFAQLAEEAKKASDENRLDDAAQLYGKALTARPTWKDGWWSLGTIQYDQDKFALAAKSFTRMLALEPKNGTAHAMLGLCQFELHQDQSALDNFLAAEKFGIVKNEELRKVAVFHLGLLQLRGQRFSSAKETLSQLAADHLQSAELIVALGESALLMRPQDSPEKGTDGFRVVNRVGDAEAALAAKEFEIARKTYSEVVAEFPEYPNIHLAYGRLLLELHQLDAALEQFQQELIRYPDNLHCLLEIAAVRYRSDSINGLPFAERAAKLAPRLPFAHYLLGILRLDVGDSSGAIPELELARKGLPEDPKIYFALGTAYAQLGNKLESAKARAEFVRLNAIEQQHAAGSDYGEQASGLNSRDRQTIDTEKPRR